MVSIERLDHDTGTWVPAPEHGTFRTTSDAYDYIQTLDRPDDYQWALPENATLATAFGF